MDALSKYLCEIKVVFLSLLFVCFLSNAYGQVSIGSYTVFPDSKLFGSAYKPQLSVGKVNDQYILSLRYVSPTTYASFDAESVLLIRLGDDSMVKLPFAKELDYEKKYENSYNKYTGTSHFYITYSYYLIDADVLSRIVKDKEVIKKIRVSFTNGNVQDWEINEKYQQKLTEGLVDSYLYVESADAVRKEKMSNVESGF